MTAFAAPLSELVAEHIRNGEAGRLGEISPCAGCLQPLLTALGWRHLNHDVIEALPHFSSTLDVPELLNMLAVLGFDSDALQIRTGELDEDLLPALFECRDELYVITARSAQGFRYYDARRNTFADGPLRRKGTAHVFTDRSASRAVGERIQGAWFSDLLARFRKQVKHLLAATLLLNVTALAVPLFIMTVYDRIIGTGSLEALPSLALGMAFVLLVEFGLRLTRARTLALVASRMDYLIGVETFRQIVSLPPLLSERSSVAAQLATLKQFDSVREFVSGPTAALALEAPFVVLLIGVMWWLAGSLALIPVVMLLLYALFGLIFLPIMKRGVIAAGAARTARQALLMETLNGLRELKALGAESVWRERFRESSADTLTSLYRTSVTQSVLESSSHALMTASGVAVLGFGAIAVMDGTLSVGALIASMALMWRILGPVQGLFMGYVKFDQIINGVRTINQLMKLNAEPATGKADLLSAQQEGKVRLDRVSFRYGPNSDPAALGVSFEIAPREFVAIMGDNSSGKSTLLKLMAGVYTCQSGSVYIDGIDTRQYNPVDLRRRVAYVPQTPYLFHGTIAQNMRFKNTMATQHDLERAADEAGILEAILALPDGFSTRVGDHTTDRLPSGFIRGLCLARAFVRPTPLVLLDEPGTALDLDSDQLLVAQIQRIRLKRTIIMVSHRPSHIRLADRAILVTQGMVKFIGAPEQALAKT